MAKVVYAPSFFAGLKRIAHHLRENDADAPAVVETIIEALEILARHPFVGRPVESGLHELVMGKRRRGYVALYRVDPVRDMVIVLAIRAGREAGY